MIIKGLLYADTPIYRGNSRKTLFTRDGDGARRLVSLAGEISGAAQTMMDAFIGTSRNRRNIGLLNQLWKRMYGKEMPGGLIRKVDCNLREESYPRNNFFDLRMGMKLDEDRWAAEANANYKMETILRHSVFDFVMSVRDSILNRKDNAAKLHYLLEELTAGRFWFGAGKSKGLGRVHLEADLPPAVPGKAPAMRKGVNHLRIDVGFDGQNPFLVGWNWGKIDPLAPSFASVEARLLIETMKELPGPVRERMAMFLGGPILNPDDWKRKFSENLPRMIAIWLKERSAEEVDVWVLPAGAASKLGRGGRALGGKLVSKLKSLADQSFSSREEATEALKNTPGLQANLVTRAARLLERRREERDVLNPGAWRRVAEGMGLDPGLADPLSESIHDEAAMTRILTPACKGVEPILFSRVDQQVKLLQSDGWVDTEIQTREEHIRIKTMLLQGRITEKQWMNRRTPPEGVNPGVWKEFMDLHARVRYRHMLNASNLKKSVTNDRNQIAFLRTYRDRTRQELSRPRHIDFRAGGPFHPGVSRKYGKSYDRIFMRMLSWAPSTRERGAWEIYIPGGTIKGAFRKRASQMLKTLWGETRETNRVIDRLFGSPGARGLVFFSDAYLVNPDNVDRRFCSLDGIRMDPQTGRPIESAKRDYLFAHGKQLRFRFQIDLQDIRPGDLAAVSALFHLILDFRRGEIPLGREKTNGLGWVKADISGLTWLTGAPDQVHRKLFGSHPERRLGPWLALELAGEAAAGAIEPFTSLETVERDGPRSPPKARAGFISHRAFGGCCGKLVVMVEPRTPTHIRESGEPSFTGRAGNQAVDGWDFHSISPAAAEDRASDRLHAIPGPSLKGMIRHIYAIASNARKESVDISRLNAADSLFGWVGDGPNQALMGRVSFSFAPFEHSRLAWFKTPYPYGEWRRRDRRWIRESGAAVDQTRIAGKWRLFRHAPLAPDVERMDSFEPDATGARFFRAMLPGSKARFTIRFWNLLESELRRLIWCTALEEGLAHKLGGSRYLGFGSVKSAILPESYLIDWNRRYMDPSSKKWQRPLDPSRWRDIQAIHHYKELKRALNANDL